MPDILHRLEIDTLRQRVDGTRSGHGPPRVTRILAGAVSALCLLATAAVWALPPRWPMPAVFCADRVYLECAATHGGRLRLYTDTGGAMVVAAPTLARLGLQPRAPTDPALRARLGRGARVIAMRSLGLAAPIPLAHAPMVVVPAMRQLPGWPLQGDGILGQAWFAGHVWTWNYPAGRLWLDPPGWTPAGAHAVPLGFPVDARGRRVDDFPRIVVRIDGSAVPLLLDTGAETYLTRAALSQLRDGGPRLRATSMIIASLFERWHREHPGWRVIRMAQTGTGAAMIEVPRVRVAGLRVGPVWFTERPDANFLKVMSSMTSAPVYGSLGGNALRDLRMTIDYPRARTWFMRGR